MIIVIAFIVSLAAIFLGLMLFGALIHLWPLLALVGLWLIARDIIRLRNDARFCCKHHQDLVH